ncbi:MAG TPA: hypothetical protein VKZ92_03120 [Pseudohongiella sp.]|nr:hypothetical protein [Pseudohongiella sp.]
MLRSMLLKICLCVPFMFAVGASAQTDGNPDRAVIEIIEISNRNPIAVKAEIEPALDPRGSIGVMDNKLIIASTAANVPRLRELVAGADIPLRRLVVSVDFDHSSPMDASAQQSQQAIEGDVVRFDAASNTFASDIPQVLVHTNIRNNLAITEVEVLNVPGFTGVHQLQLDLGRWYVLNPPEDELEEFEFDPALDGTPDIPVAEAEAMDLAAADIPPAVPAPAVENPVAPIAVRVDVLP